MRKPDRPSFPELSVRLFRKKGHLHAGRIGENKVRFGKKADFHLYEAAELYTKGTGEMCRQVEKNSVDRQMIEAALDEYVRPLLAAHGGDMAVDRVEDGVVYFRMLGHCAGCAAADLTSEDLINKELVEHVPGVKKAVLINEVSQNLIDQALDILRKRHAG